jgi:glycosyltransferase involved in cell wall biosynthesis
LRKQEIYQNANLTFVGCSRWIADLASESVLTRGKRVLNIANAINTELFRPQDKAGARRKCGLPEDKRLILFGAAKTTDPRKGMSYLIEALKLLVERYNDVKERVEVVLVGGRDSAYAESFPLRVHPMGYVSDELQMVDIYNSADIYVTPSLQDNLPNTIVEAMSCGLPCVGFNTGGVPQMITHGANGYVAEYCSADDLAAGMHKLLFDSDLDALSEVARDTAVSQYSEPVAAQRYADVYRAGLDVAIN